jgi:hypothetical protein
VHFHIRQLCTSSSAFQKVRGAMPSVRLVIRSFTGNKAAEKLICQAFSFLDLTSVSPITSRAAAGPLGKTIFCSVFCSEALKTCDSWFVATQPSKKTSCLKSAFF